MAPTGKLLRAATSRRLAATTKPQAGLSTKQCLGIVKKLGQEYLSAQPSKLQELVRRLREGLVAHGIRNLDAEKATGILWKVLREINMGLQKCLEDAQAALDNADAETEVRIATAAAAEVKLNELCQAMAERSGAVKDALKIIENSKSAMATKTARRQSQETDAKKVETRKRRLEEVERESYEPLRRGPAEGEEGRKRLVALRRTGKAYGFHKDLLNVAPVVLRKPLDARRTFDALIVDQLDNEFSKHVRLLTANSKDSERDDMEYSQQVHSAEEELVSATAKHKKSSMELKIAAAAVFEAREKLLEAKACVRKLPADLKRAEGAALKMEARLLKFQRGPRAAFEKALGLEYGAVASMADVFGYGAGNVSMENIACGHGGQ